MKRTDELIVDVGCQTLDYDILVSILEDFEIRMAHLEDVNRQLAEALVRGDDVNQSILDSGDDEFVSAGVRCEEIDCLDESGDFPE